MKKLFGEVNLNWLKLLAMAIIVGICVSFIAMISMFNDTSFSDPAVSFEVWIFFGIFIITNSKSATDSALKCFVFFLVSQPLIYLIQDAFEHNNLFLTYYRYWFMWTIACLPMGFIGYYMKKDKWWSLLILIPMLFILGETYSRYLSMTMFSFPRHILTVIFCIATLLIYPICIFKNKKVKISGAIISGLIIIIGTIFCTLNPLIYSTDLFASGDKYEFDDTYKVYLVDSKYGELNIEYVDAIESWIIHANFIKSGKTKFVIESPSGERKSFDLVIKRDSFDFKEIKK